jgi:hypothetical protein
VSANASQAADEAQQVRLSGLAQQDRVVIDTSTGTRYGSSRYLLEFTGFPDALVKIYEVPADASTEDQQYLGEFQLSSVDIERLDSGLAELRTDATCDSTWHKDVRVSLYRGSQLVRSEHLSRDWCGLSRSDEVLYPEDLVLLVGAANWSVAANCRHHQAVLDHVTHVLASQPERPNRETLEELVGSGDAPDD